MRWLFAAVLLSLLPVQPAAAQTSAQSNAPNGFEDLTSARLVVIDVYFAGKKISQSQSVLENGKLRFVDPSQVLAALPELEDRERILMALRQPLDQNSHLVCGPFNADGCGALTPDLVGLIVNEDRFRVDLFISPRLISAGHEETRGYIRPTFDDPGLAYSAALTVSGSDSNTEYFVQNDLIGSLGSTRARTRMSVSSAYGTEIETAELEKDFDGWRARAGLFFVPGNEFTGRRRLLGAGFTTQLDTRSEREELMGLPLPLFLSRPARVEIYVEGRLASAEFYEGGNVNLDSSDLPTGSYPISIRVIEGGRAVREEERFFTKREDLPPLGETSARVFGGVLDRFDGGLGTPYFESALAHRLTSRTSLDGSAVATDKKFIMQFGATALSSIADLRASALISSANDKGIRLEAASRGVSPVTFHADLRRVWSAKGGAIVPIGFDLRTVSGSREPTLLFTRGSYTQILGSMRYRRGPLGLGFSGYYRKDDGFDQTYAFGPSIEYNLVQNERLRLDLVGDVQKTNSSLSSFAGVRLFAGFGPVNASARTGFSTYNPSQAPDNHHMSADADISASKELTWGRAYGSAGFLRDIEQTAVRMSAAADHRLGHVRGEVVQAIEGSNITQYAFSARSGAAYSNRQVSIVGSRFREAAVVVKVTGDSDTQFDILVDAVERNQVKPGSPTTLFLQPYRKYRISIRPKKAKNIAFDPAPKEVILFPGNVAPVSWNVARKVTFFGQLKHEDGNPIRRTVLRSSHGIGRTDDEGYFQIDAGSGEKIFAEGDERCAFELPLVSKDTEFAPIEEVICAR